MMRQHNTQPMPFVYEENAMFWEGTRRHELMIQHCKDCGNYQFYPRSTCTACLSENLEWVKSSGYGKVYSFTVAHRPGGPAFVDAVPYNIAIIELDEGVRMASTIVECSNEDIKCDMPVQVVFEDLSPELALPKFKPKK